jgi:hypothetical protein
LRGSLSASEVKSSRKQTNRMVLKADLVSTTYFSAWSAWFRAGPCWMKFLRVHS